MPYFTTYIAPVNVPYLSKQNCVMYMLHNYRINVWYYYRYNISGLCDIVRRVCLFSYLIVNNTCCVVYS